LRLFSVSIATLATSPNRAAAFTSIKDADVGPPASRPKGCALLHYVAPLRVWRAASAGQSRRMIAVEAAARWGWAPWVNIMETTMNNVVNLIGRLGDKPTCRTLNDGARVANLSIATDDGYKGRDGTWVKRTTWHRVTIFGDKRVDYIEEHYAKGDLVQFSGRLSYSQSERDGVKYNNAELIGSTSLLASVSREEKPATKSKASGRKKQEPQYQLDEEIPF